MGKKSDISKYINMINDSIASNDYNGFDKAKRLLEGKVSSMRRNYELLSESKSNNFGVLNDIIVENIPLLFKKNRKLLSEIMKLIKEDVNLSSQFKFYNTLSEYNNKLSESVSSDEYIDKAISLVRKNVNRRSLLESNKKLSNILVKNGIKPSSMLDEGRKSYFNDCQKLIMKNVSLGNMSSLMESKKNIGKYIDEHKKNVLSNVNEGVTKNVFNMLNEDERDLVQQITDFKSANADNKKSKLFCSFKDDCLNKIDKLMENADEFDKSSLMELKNDISGMKYCSETIIGDMAKLLEIRDILMDDSI